MPAPQDANLIDLGNGVSLERGVRCRMSDGVHLVSDHYYPPGAGPHPTLLMRQPYGRDIASTVTYAHPAWFARHGYNVVIQDVRGRGDSEDDFYPFRHEARDGAETIAWLSMRPESSGGIGMYGFSYQGATQLLAAAERPEGLVCIAPGMTAHDLYQGWFYRQGALRLASSLGWGLQMLKADARRLKLREASDRLEQAWVHLAAQTGTMPFRDHPALLAVGLPRYVLDWFDHSDPGEYWSSLDISQSFDRVRVPALHISGWYDTYLQGSIDGFLALTLRAGGPVARDNQFLIAGPWIHMPWGDRAGSADFGPEANLDTDTILLRWFNHWLKGSGEFAREPKIRHFVLGENRWRHAAAFPLEAKHVLYLSSAGRANSRNGDGVLSSGIPANDEVPDIFVHDPEVPVVAPGGPASASGQFDQAVLELGNNLLVYTGPALAATVRIFGQPRVSLYCATSAGHTDFVAKLVRVRPNGAADFICIGVARSSWLFAKTGYAADEIHHWQFDLEPTSCAFAAGDRIRLEIASSAFPLYDRNPGSDVPSARATSWDWRRSTQIVHHSSDHPSALYLPVSESRE
jgi:putative CocE/NonD family hydrolase